MEDKSINEVKSAFILRMHANGGAGDNGIDRTLGVTISEKVAREWELAPATQSELDLFKPFYWGKINIIKEVFETNLIE